MVSGACGPVALTEEAVRSALGGVRYPGLTRDIVALGMVRSVAVRDGRVHVALMLATERPEVPDQLRAAVKAALAEAGAVRSEVQIVAPDRRLPVRDPWADRGRLPGVARVVAVGAGKGGVGKSTVAVNLALALKASGLRVGLMDADIYGPSVPVLVGLEDGAKRVRMTDDRKIIPMEALGLSVVSFGFFLGPESPAVWRGPMVGKAVKQFSRGVVWPDLDVLVVDLPPGTGDVPLSLAQSIVLDGAIVVTTPQRLSVLEAAKAVEMFGKLDVPVLGVVENMSFAACECGRSHPFGTGGGDLLHRMSGAPLLGQVPFEEVTVEDADTGLAAVTDRPEGLTAGAFREISGHVRQALSLEATAETPTIQAVS